MATLCVTVPDESAARIVAAVAAGERAQIADMSDGVDLVRRVVFRWLTNATLEYEAQLAAQSVRTNPDDPLVSAVITQGEG